MSWASHNPEAWLEVEISGVMTKLTRSSVVKFNPEAVEETIREYLVYTIIWKALTDWAHQDILAAEANYHADLADQAEMQCEGRKDR
jgi:hypothetical protein